MTAAISRRGTFALMVAHCAGMVDLVSLPVWIGTLVQRYRFDPQQAGGIVTLFLLGAVVASVIVATRASPLLRPRIAAIGFLVSAGAFAAMATTVHVPTLAALHLAAGLATGSALSVTHGTIGQSLNPHRLFALVGIALGVFAILFMAIAAPLATKVDGFSLFILLAGVMATAAAASLAAFPHSQSLGTATDRASPRAPIPAMAWFAAIGISVMALVQAMVFSFLERAGNSRGFSTEAITAVLIAIGVVNLFPAALAALFQHRLRAQVVLLAGPVAQAALALSIMNSTAFLPYAAAASMLSAVMIFTHTFAFGLVGRLDPGGRILSATPAMLMAGAAIGPVLGGTLVKMVGYSSVGIAAACLACVAVGCFLRVNHGADAGLLNGLAP